MNIQLLSDLHFEFHRDGGQEFISSLDSEGVDVLALAGDINTVRGLDTTLGALCEKYPHVVYVTGNHEYYRSHPDVVHGTLWKLGRRFSNFHWLHHRKVEIDGVVFAGTTLWFPEPRGEVYIQRNWLNDYSVIRGFVPWVYQEHKAAVAFLDDVIQKADVVLTHHMPAEVCIPPRYRVGRWAPMNHFFCYDMTPLIMEKGPKFWFYGHTHDRAQHRVGRTTLIGNPLGYPHEQGDVLRGPYTEKLVVKV